MDKPLRCLDLFGRHIRIVAGHNFHPDDIRIDNTLTEKLLRSCAWQYMAMTAIAEFFLYIMNHAFPIHDILRANPWVVRAPIVYNTGN